MGDMADYFIGQFPACWEEDSDSYYTPPTKTCNRCGEKGLTWTLTYEGWRLAKNGVIHKCKKEATCKKKL